MVKRPLVWILGAFLLGLVLARQQVSFVIISAIGIIGYALIYCAWQNNKKPGFHRKQVFLWILPLFLLLGYVVMEEQSKLPKLYYVFDQEIPCELTGRIKMVVRRKQGQALYVENNHISLLNGDSYSCENVIVYLSNDQIYRIGNRITVHGSLQKFNKASNPGQFDEENYYKTLNIDFKMMAEQIMIADSDYSFYASYLDDMKSRLIMVYDDILDDREAGTLTAMLLGEKYLLEDEVKQLYQENGISHVLAISGLHVSLIGMSIFWLLRKCRLSGVSATISTVFIIYSYGVMTNFSVSTNRAVVMMVILLLSAPIGKTYDMLSATALSALIILLQNPFQLMSAGFLLSFLAVIGIAVLLPVLRQLFPGDNKIKDSLLISSSAMLTTTPLILYYFYQYPLYSILTNLLILPFVTVLTLTSLIAGLLGILNPELGVFVIGGANYILKLYELVCEGVRHLPNHMINVGKPHPYLLIISFLFLLSFLWVAKKYNKKTSFLLLLASQCVLFLPHNNPGLEVTLLDVGQGDAIYMESREGTTFMIDGGSSSTGHVGRYRIVPFLKAKGVNQLDYAILTHMDQDHISGIIEMIEEKEFTIDNIILPYLLNKDKQYAELEELAANNKIKLQYIKAGDRIQEGLLYIDCLHPSADFVGFTANSYSTVLSVSYGEFDMLLTGDLEENGERLLVQELREGEFWRKWGNTPAVDYDVLKIAHHGSKYSTSEELLELIQPEYSIISCSKNNRYGHPHPELLERLSDSGSKALITYNTGAITLRTDGSWLEIEEYLNLSSLDGK